MKGYPWLKFYPDHWRSDPALRCVSLAARGLWIEMLGIMHAAPERGVLTINGKAPSIRQIAANVSAAVEEVTAALAELEDNDVCSRTPEGLIYSRRMVRDAADQDESVAAGSRGAAKRWGRVIAPPIGEGSTSAPARAPSSSPSPSPSVSPSSSSGEASECPAPTTPRARRKPAQDAEAVAARSEYADLLADTRAADAWQSWLEWTGTAGARAKPPAGKQAAAILNAALRAGPVRFAAAVEYAIAGNYLQPTYQDAPRSGVNGNAQAPHKSYGERAADQLDAMVAQARADRAAGIEPKQLFGGIR